MTSPFNKVRLAFVILFVLLAVNFLAAQGLRPDTPGALDRVPDGAHGQGSGVMAAAPSGGSVVQGNGINYHGGPVMAGDVPIYLIWYGNWTNGAKVSDSAVTTNLIELFLGSSALGESTYEAINTTYGDNTNNVSGHLHFAAHAFDNYSSGTKLRDNTLPTIVSRAIATGALGPADPNGVYVILTSSDVNETSGFCRTYCGFHTHATINGADLKYAFIGNVDKCPSGCEAQATGPNSPSASVGGADGMINTMTHETEEAITDPDLNAWFDSSGQEDADKCNFKFGPVSTCSGTLCTSAAVTAAAKFNQSFGGKSWLIQMEWENSRGGGCDQTLGGAFH